MSGVMPEMSYRQPASIAPTTLSVHCDFIVSQPDRRQRSVLRRQAQTVTQQVLAACQRLFRRGSRQVRVIIRLGQMRQYQERGTSIIVAGEELRETGIRQVAGT